MAQNRTFKTARTGLPHGMVPISQIGDPQVRDAVMKLNENIVWLARRFVDSEAVFRGLAGRSAPSAVPTSVETAELARAIPFGVVDSNSTTDFTATVPGVTELRGGVVMWLMNNGNKTSASGWTLNVNGLGAKPVYQSLAAEGRVTTTFNLAYTMLFVYNEERVDGGCWDMVYGYNSNTTYTPPKLGFGYAECTTAAATVAKAATCDSYTLVVGGMVAVHFANAVPASATLNIRTRGAKPMWYRGSAIAAGVIQAGDTALFIYDGTAYRLLCIDRIGGGAA